MFATTFRGLLIAGALLAFAAPAHAAVSVLDNGTVRVGVDLQHGDLTWLSRSHGEYADNLLLASEQSYYGGPYLPDGSPTWHGYQDIAVVNAHSNNGKTIYARAYSLTCECVMQTWVTLRGNAVIVRNRLTNSRSDPTPYAAGWQELPALYAQGPNRLVTYQGAAPFTHAPTEDDTANARGEFYTPSHFGFTATEHWAALVNKAGFGIGLVEPDQVNLIGITGSENGWPSGYLSGVRQEVMDSNIVYDYTYTLVVGTVGQIRAYAYAHRPDPRPTYLFAHDREHFTEVNATDNGFPINGALRVHVDQWDPQLVGPDAIWPAKRVPRLYVRGAWHTDQVEAQLFWSGLGGTFTETQSRAFRVIPDGTFKTYRIDLFQSAEYAGLIDRIRLDPVAGLDPGGWVDISCISYKPCPVNSAAEVRLQTDGGHIPLLDQFNTLDASLWSVTGNSTGVTTSISDGKLRIDVAPDAQPLLGQTYISAGVYGHCNVSGNFDVRVDYSLDDWPAANGVNLNFSVGNVTIFRHNDSTTGESLAVYAPPAGGGQILDSDSSGTLRLTRANGLVRAFHLDAGGRWGQLDAVDAPGPLPLGLSIYTNRSTIGAKEVVVGFDNFRVLRGSLTCQ